MIVFFKQSKEIDNAVRALKILRTNQHPITVSSLAILLGTTTQWLHQIMRRLKLKGLVAAVKGPHGGYLFNQELDRITVMTVANALDKSPVVYEDLV